MQLIPETAIRIRVRNPTIRTRALPVGRSSYALYWTGLMGICRLALVTKNTGERKVNLYGQIPPHEETQNYVKEVIGYYRSYEQDGWVMPVSRPAKYQADRTK